MTLLSDAAAAGLTVRADGDRLVIRGPRGAEAVARRLLGHKAEVMAALGRPDAPGDPRQAPRQPQGEPSGDAPGIDGGVSGCPDFSGWAPRPDFGGRLGLEAPDLPEGQRWWAIGGFDELPEAGDGCPECGSLETWSDLAGGRHCAGCERAGLERALKLADRAARLRRRSGLPPRRPEDEAPADWPRPLCGPGKNFRGGLDFQVSSAVESRR